MLNLDPHPLGVESGWQAGCQDRYPLAIKERERVDQKGLLTDPDTWDGVRGFFSRNFSAPVLGLVQKGLERLAGREHSTLSRVVVEDLRRLMRSVGERMAIQQIDETRQSLAELLQSLRGEQPDPDLSTTNTQGE